jgi:hypothetical protein
VVLHRRRRLHGGGGDLRRRRWGNWAQLHALVCCGCKGRCRSSSACLNRSVGRKAKGGRRAPRRRLPLMVAAITARCKERGNGPNRAWVIKCLNWQACWGEKGRGEGGAGRDPRGCGGGPASRGKKKRKGEMERLTSGAQVSATAKEKKRERERRAGAG